MGIKFNILVLSDSHFGQPRSGLDSVTVLDSLVTDIIHVSAEYKLKPNLIVYAGDIAFGHASGTVPLSVQYDFGKQFIANVYSKLNIPFSEVPLMMVPGNHDIDREMITSALKAHRDKLSADEVDFMVNPTSTLDWDDYLRRQGEWSSFISSILEPQMALGVEVDKMFHTSSVTIPFGGLQVGIVGLNSSWASYRPDEKGHLWIGKHQYQKAFAKVKDCDFKIAVSHHPASWLVGEESGFLEQRLSTQFDIHIHGHEHSQWIVDTNRHLRLAAGACYEGSTKENGYTWISIDFAQKKGHVYLRTYTDDGAGGWCQKVVPGVTDGSGVAEVKHFLDGFDSGKATDLTTEDVETPADTKIQFAPLNLMEYMRLLEDQFRFRWEPHTFQESSARKPRIYWPVKLRRPTPIHASQCFTAAGLQRFGCEICLCIDDLGNTDYSIHDFEQKLKLWFARAGGDPDNIFVQNFKTILKENDNCAWDMVGKWLANNHYKTDKVLVISKIAKSLEFDAESIAGVRKLRPRRLLTPAMVWMCLLDLHMKDPSIPIITLGGYDERELWNAWHDCNPEVTSAKLGHLYVSALKLYNKSSTSTVYMKEIPLYWTSKRDIEDDLEKDIIENNLDDWPNHERMIPWCINNCVLLPSIIKDGSPSIVINNTTFSKLSELKAINPTECMGDIVGEVYRWLLP